MEDPPFILLDLGVERRFLESYHFENGGRSSYGGYLLQYTLRQHRKHRHRLRLFKRKLFCEGLPAVSGLLPGGIQEAEPLLAAYLVFRTVSPSRISMISPGSTILFFSNITLFSQEKPLLPLSCNVIFS